MYIIVIITPNNKGHSIFEFMIFRIINVNQIRKNLNSLFNITVIAGQKG